ncbi:MAG: M55 family metallopeptidase [Thermomicrobiales bacterium]
MKFYVSVDIEGITGVVHGDMMMAGQPEYTRGRQLMMGDANAAIAGLVAAGAKTIVVSDGHGPMRNLMIENLHPAAELVSGSGDAKPYCQLEAADSEEFDAAVFIGYHAMARTPNAIHPHTIAGAAVSELRINGHPHGETGLNAAVLASLGIPTIVVTGDQTTTTEARTFLGEQVETVTVKRARGRNAAICRPPAATLPEIEAAAKRATGKIGQLPCSPPEEPWRLEVDFLNMQQCDRASRTAGIEQTGPLSIVANGDHPWEQYRTLWAGLRSALYEPAAWLC